MSKARHIVILLVGRTGSGKSSVGNSILQKRKFLVRNFPNPLDVDEITDAHCTWEGIRIDVIDATGIGDAAADRKKDMKSDLQTLRNIYLRIINSGTPDNVVVAVVYVFKYGSGRFTQQEKNAVSDVKTLFGEGVFRNHGIVIMSCGNVFRKDSNGETSFEEWTKVQVGDFRAFLEECNDRCILFENHEADPTKQESQMKALMSCVRDIVRQSATPRLEWNEKGAEKLVWLHRLPQLLASINSFHVQLSSIEASTNFISFHRREELNNLSVAMTTFRTVYEKGYDANFSLALFREEEKLQMLRRREEFRSKTCIILVVFGIIIIIIIILTATLS